jgi:hypothetical protein
MAADILRSKKPMLRIPFVCKKRTTKDYVLNGTYPTTQYNAEARQDATTLTPIKLRKTTN